MSFSNFNPYKDKDYAHLRAHKGDLFQNQVKFFS